MMNETATEDRVWRALGDGTRRRILDLLAQRARTTGEIVAAEDDLCRTAVMKHLDVLEAAGLVIVRREGRVRWNELNPVPIDRICRRWLDKHQRRMSSALNRLKNVVEADVVESPARKKERNRI